MMMTPQEELDLALAEVAAAKAELAAARAEVEDAKAEALPKRPAARKVQRPAAREKRPVHRSDLRSECYGTGERFTSSDGLRRTDFTPVVTKEYDPTDRPNVYKYEERECLLVADILLGNTDSDSWKRCKCIHCVEIRK
jgi:hypothetical protein